MFLVPSLQDSNSTLSGSFLAIFFCSAVSSCVNDNNHRYLVSERLFLAENKAFPYPRRAGAHPRRAGVILWDAAANSPAVFFVAVAPKQRSPKLNMSWLTLYGLADRLPVSAGNFGRALQRHFSVDFQTQDVVGKIFSCSKRACFAFVNRMRNGRAAFARSCTDASISRLIEDWGSSAASERLQRHFQSIFKTKVWLERSFPALNEHVLLLWIERETAEQRSLDVGRSIISRLIEDRGRSEVQPSSRLSEVRETRAALETLTWRKYETKCRIWKGFSLFSAW